MVEENKPSDTNESELELGSESGEENVSGEETSTDTPDGSELEKLNKLTGKDFKSVDDFQKHYENLKSFSGTEEAQELRKKAKLYDELQKEKPEDKVKEEGTPDDKFSELNNKFNKSEFLRENPDAKEHFDLVEAIASQNKVSFKEAWDSKVKDLAVAKSEKDKEHSDIIDSKSKTTPLDTQKINQLIDNVKQTDSFEAKQRLVEKTMEKSN